MKNVIAILPIFVLAMLGCNQPPLIMQSQYTMTLPGEIGTSGKANFDTFQSTASGTKTALTFTNADGDMVEFQVTSLKIGTFSVGSGLIVTGTLAVNDPNGNLIAVQYQSSNSGFINIDGISGSGSNITGLTGSFKVNIESNSDDPLAIGTTGVIQGVFNFNNSAS